jgi:hypothetical protein
MQRWRSSFHDLLRDHHFRDAFEGYRVAIEKQPSDAQNRPSNSRSVIPVLE